MKRLVLFLAVTCFTSSAVLAGGLGAFGSYWDTKDADAGYGYGVRLASTSDPVGYLEVRASYFNTHSIEQTTADVDLEIIPIDVGITMNLGSEESIQLYLGAGGSYFLMDSEVKQAGLTRDIDIDDEWGWYALVGFELDFSKSFSLFGEGTYRQVKGDVSDSTLDIEFKLDGFGGNVGLMFMF